MLDLGVVPGVGPLLQIARPPVGSFWRQNPPCGEELALAGEAGEDRLALAVHCGGGNQPAPRPGRGGEVLDLGVVLGVGPLF